jgi:hypothetical protein
MLAQALRRVLRAPRAPRLRQRSAQGYLNLIRTDGEAARAAILLARYGRRNSSLVRALLRDLWELDTTALYVQIDGAPRRAELVVTRSSRHHVVATGQKFRVEIQTHEPAPNGAYRIAREYRQPGFYEQPPAERVLVTARIRAGAGTVHLLHVPECVSHVTVVINDRILASAVSISDHREIRYELPVASDR